MGIYKRLILIFILWISLFTANIYAENSIIFENITKEDGLSQATVEAIIQDNKGYIWIGTNDGLNRYNGDEIIEFKSSVDKKNTIISNYIICLAEDKNNNLWVGTDQGISRINLENYSIKNYRKDGNNIPYHSVQSIYVDSKDEVYIGSNKGIYKYDSQLDNFVSIENINNQLYNKDIFSIIEVDENKIIIGCKKGLNIVDKKNNTCTIFKTKEEDSTTWGNIQTMMVDDDNKLWVGTSEKGLKIIDLDNNQIVTFKNIDENQSIKSKSVRDIIKSSDSTIWLATEEGLVKHLGDGKFYTYTSNEYDNNSLSSNIVFSLMQDRTGIIWAGTYTGISKFDSSNKIYLYKHNPFNENSISGNVIMGTYEDEDGLIWVGTRDKGLNVIDRKKDKVTRIVGGYKDYNLTTDAINFITGKGQTIWVGTRNGVNKIDKKNKTIEKYTVENGLVDNNIKSLLLDSKNNLWIGTTRGLNILDIETGKITNINERLKKNGLNEPYVQSMYEDSDGIIWIGGYNDGGLIKFDTEADKITIYYDKEVESSLAVIRDIKEDKQKNLWIGTNYGIMHFDKKTEKFKVYTEEDGLANNIVYGVLFDENQNLWLSTNNGISKFNIKDNRFSNLTITDGLQNNEFNGHSSYKCKSGEFIFGGIGGLNIFHPKDVFSNKSSESVKFDSFEVEGKKYSDINGRVFKYNENFIRIKYFIPDYRKNNNRRYFYQMIGSSQKWVELKNNEVIFNDLPSGNYTFNIKSRNSNGIMSDVNSVSFKIESPFWATPTAILIYLLIIIYWIYRNKNRVKILDELVDKKTKQLYKEMDKNKVLYEKVIEAERSKNNYFINLSHELRTPLNVINSIEQLIRRICNSDKEITQEKLLCYMDITRSNTDRLLNLINNIIDTSKIENGRYKLNLDYHDIVYIVEEASLSLKQSIESVGIDLIIDTDIEEKIILCDKYDIERCIVNLVNNAQKFTPAGGQILVNIYDLNDHVKITVEDTGIGIDEKYYKTIFNRFDQIVDKHSEEKGGSGLGLTITKQIIELHRGSISVESEKGKGTKFTIILPTDY